MRLSLSLAPKDPPIPEPQSHPSDEPLLFAFIDGLREVGVVVHDGGVCALCGLRALRFVGVVGTLVAEHVANEEDQGAENGENHHGDDPWWRRQENQRLNEPSTSPRSPQTLPSPIYNTKGQNDYKN